MIEAKTIDEVIHELDNIIVWSKEKQSRIGYFACLYKKMTIAVKLGIQNNMFDDGARMEKLDVIFANRYLHAWDAYVNKRKCTNAWCAAFDYCNSNNLIVLQHLILGVNTHINLDLGIAAAVTAPVQAIYTLEEDFRKINDVIESMVQTVQDTLSEVWFPLKLIAKISNKQQDAVINFSIKAARQTSWANAVSLATITGDANANYINIIDKTVVTIAARVANPGLVLNFILKSIRMMEPKSVSNLIDLLNNDSQKVLVK